MSQTPSSFTPTPYTPSSDASFTPTQGTYKELKPFRYWCQKVLPLVYDDSLSYYELLCKVVDYLNKTMEDVDTLHDDVDNLHTAYTQLENDMNVKYHSMTQWMNSSYTDLVNFVNTYFANLDVQEEINNKLDVMATDGTLSALIEPYVQPKVNNKINSMVTSGEFADIVEPFVEPAVDDEIEDMVDDGRFKAITDPKVIQATDAWLAQHITNPSNPPLDDTLLLENAAAQSKAAGNKIGGLRINNDWFTSHNITSFVDLPFGTYFVILTNKGDFGFPNGSIDVVNWTLRVTKAVNDTSNLFKIFELYGVSVNAPSYIAVCNEAFTAANPPRWRRANLDFIVGGTRLNDTDLSAYGITYFGDLPFGTYYVALNTAGTYGFDSKLGRLFTLIITKGVDATGVQKAYKTAIAFGNAGGCYYTFLLNENSLQNLSTWWKLTNETPDNTLRVSGIAADSAVVGKYIRGRTPAYRSTDFVNDNIDYFGDLPFGTYYIGLTTAGTFGFPSYLGTTFTLVLIHGSNADNDTAKGFKTAIAYSTTGKLAFCVLYNESTLLNPAAWFLVNKNNTYVVGSDNSCDFSSVTDAIATVPSGSTVYVKKGTYNNEAIQGWGKNIHIIGEDRETTIIQNDYNDYDNSVIEMSSGIIENLTIKSIGTGTSPHPQGWGGYGLHIEGSNVLGQTLVIKNCNIYSATNYGAGVGLKKNCHVIFDNCYLTGADHAGLFFHDSSIASGDSQTGVQNITIRNSTFKNETGTVALRIDSQSKQGATVNCSFQRNIVCSDVGAGTVQAVNQTGDGGTTVGTLLGLHNFYKSSDSNLNTDSGLNN